MAFTLEPPDRVVEKDKVAVSSSFVPHVVSTPGTHKRTIVTWMPRGETCTFVVSSQERGWSSFVLEVEVNRSVLNNWAREAVSHSCLERLERGTDQTHLLAVAASACTSEYENKG